MTTKVADITRSTLEDAGTPDLASDGSSANSQETCFQDSFGKLTPVDLKFIQVYLLIQDFT